MIAVMMISLIILFLYALASAEDERTRLVTDAWHYGALACIFALIAVMSNDYISYWDKYGISILLPLLFTLLSCRTRGAADTYEMLIMAAYCFATCTDPSLCLWAYLFAYICQMVRALIARPKGQTVWAALKTPVPLPFLAALTSGFALMVGITFIKLLS